MKCGGASPTTRRFPRFPVRAPKRGLGPPASPGSCPPRATGPYKVRTRSRYPFPSRSADHARGRTGINAAAFASCRRPRGRSTSPPPSGPRISSRRSRIPAGPASRANRRRPPPPAGRRTALIGRIELLPLEDVDVVPLPFEALLVEREAHPRTRRTVV